MKEHSTAEHAVLGPQWLISVRVGALQRLGSARPVIIEAQKANCTQQPHVHKSTPDLLPCTSVHFTQRCYVLLCASSLHLQASSLHVL